MYNINDLLQYGYWLYVMFTLVLSTLLPASGGSQESGGQGDGKKPDKNRKKSQGSFNLANNIPLWYYTCICNSSTHQFALQRMAVQQ